MVMLIFQEFQKHSFRYVHYLTTQTQWRHLRGAGGPSPLQGKTKKRKRKRKKNESIKEERKKEGKYEQRQITTYIVLFFPIFQ